MSKPRVYWRPENEGCDPDDACWAVKIGNCSFGMGSWNEAYSFAYLTAALERLDV